MYARLKAASGSIVLSTGLAGSFSSASDKPESRKSDRSHRLRVRAAPVQRVRIAQRCAARCTCGQRGNAACQAAQQRTPFHGLLFSALSLSLSLSLRPMDSIWKTTCWNLRRPRKLSPVCALIAFSFFPSLSYLHISVSSFFFSAIAVQLEYRFEIVKPRDWNYTLVRGAPLHLGIIDRLGDGGRARDR